jgi:hypothetical protein
VPGARAIASSWSVDQAGTVPAPRPSRTSTDEIVEDGVDARVTVEPRRQVAGLRHRVGVPAEVVADTIDQEPGRLSAKEPFEVVGERLLVVAL